MKIQPTTKELIEMLYERLPELFDRAAPVQEHVATLIEHYAFTDGIVRFDGVENMEQLPIGTKLYTTPPTVRQWVGLTDEEKQDVCNVGPVYTPDSLVTRKPLEYRKELEGVALMAVLRAEAKLKEKNIC